MLHLAPAIVWVALAPGPADDTALRVELTRTLQEMTAAALAGDGEAYLSHISRADPEYYNEQKYFANELRKHPPAELRMELGEGAVKPGDGAAEAPFTMTWRMPDRTERTVSYPVRFVQKDGAWLFAGEAWESHAQDGVLVMHDPGLDELAKRTAEAFLAVRGHVESLFGLGDAELSRRTQKIKIYGSMKHLQASIMLNYEDSLGGWNEPGEPIKLLAGEKTNPARLRQVLAHEYGHVATFALGEKANSMPWWTLEGVADFSAARFAGGTPDRAVRAWAKADRLAPWDQISDFENTPKKHMGHVYAQGHHMVAYVTERFGDDGRNRWLTLMAKGASLDAATREAFGRSWEDLDNEWRASLKPKEDGAAKGDGDAPAKEPAKEPAGGEKK